jgi:UrcA family protein
MFCSIKISVVFIAIVTFAQGAVAQSHPGVGVRVDHAAVSYGDLNLNNARDARVMLERITHAASHACGGMASADPAYDIAPLFADQAFRHCRKRAIEKAVANLNAPMVSKVAQVLGRQEPSR